LFALIGLAGNGAVFGFQLFALSYARCLQRSPLSCKAIDTGGLWRRVLFEPPSNPLPPGDLWGQEWLIDTIQSNSLGQAVRLNVLPSIAEISVHTLEVVALYKEVAFDISAFRRFTLGGDVVAYDQQAIDYYNWYAVKSGKQSGFKFVDRISENNYNRIQVIHREFRLV
jgi:hypothetical protein